MYLLVLPAEVDDGGYAHIVEELGKIEFMGRPTPTRGILAFCGERGQEVSVYDLAVRPKLGGRDDIYV